MKENEETVTLEKEDTEEDDTLFCAMCGFAITAASEQIPVKGKASHRFTNPVGYMFEIGCFRTAKGCGSTGDKTEEFTWFPRYAWNYAVCKHCLSHLGWKFSSGKGSGFWGLILNRLTSNPS